MFTSIAGEYARVQTDVLVVGGGGAALRAALAVAETGASPLLVSKGEAGKSGATYYSAAEIGAFNVPDGALDPTDNPDEFYADIMEAAHGASVPELSRIVADEAVEALRYLEACGMPFKRTADGGYSGYQACFSRKARSHIVENHFKPLVKALSDRVKDKGLETMNGLTVTDLIVRDGQCAGTVGLDGSGRYYVFEAKSVILATGGAGVLFGHNMYPGDVTGDGYAAGFRAGAELANMEFLQCGLGLAHPVVNLLGNQLWEAMPRLTNAGGEAFLGRYTDRPEAQVIREKGRHFPFSVSDGSKYVEIGVKKEVEGGHGNSRGNVYLDFTGADFRTLMTDAHPGFRNTWPNTVERFHSYGIDLYTQPIEITNFAHAINGGLLIDAHGETTIPNLFAVGETAAGPHGADRLGGNMSVTCQVFGRRAGQCAGERCAGMRTIPVDHASEFGRAKERLEAASGISSEHLDAVRRELQSRSDEALLIIRTGAGLERYLEALDGLQKQLGEREDGRQASLLECQQVMNLITTGRLIARTALIRKESRGSHYREDFPDTDPAYDGSMLKIHK